MSERLERAVAVREVSGSSPGQGGQKNLCGRRKLSDYVSFLRAVERQRSHTLNAHDTKPRRTQHFLQNFETRYRSVPTRCRSLVSSRMTYSAVCRMSEKNASSYKLHMTPSMV